MAGITLDDLHKVLDDKYGPFVVDLGETKVNLINPLRMSSEQRADLAKAQNMLSAQDKDDDDETDEEGEERLEEITAAYEAMLTASAEDAKQGKALVAALGHDIAALTEIARLYRDNQSLGEATPSQS